MEQDIQVLLNSVNRGIIQMRGAYSIWAKQHGISYNEMLVLYMIREYGYCTQKQICDNYLLPRQTMNYVISVMRGHGLLQYSPEYSTGKEKAFVLTPAGTAYASPLLDSLNEMETRVAEGMGQDRIQAMTQLMQEYYHILNVVMEEKSK